MEVLRPLYLEEPGPGEPACFTRMPSLGEVTGKVNFRAGDTLLVEYAVTGRMTGEYESTKAILCCPLQTGSTWAGNIGSGRVTVVPSDGTGGEQITFAAGVMMPPPARRSSFIYIYLADSRPEGLTVISADGLQPPTALPML